MRAGVLHGMQLGDPLRMRSVRMCQVWCRWLPSSTTTISCGTLWRLEFQMRRCSTVDADAAFFIACGDDDGRAA